MAATTSNPVSQLQFQGWASFYGGNVQAPAPPPPSFFGASALGQPPSNGQYTGGWAYPDAWANFYEGKQGFVSPQNQNTPAGALAATNYAQNTSYPNDPNLLGWEQAYGNPSTILARDKNWAQSLGSAPTNTPSGGLTGGWQNPEAWAAYYGGTNGFTAPANAGSPASALAAASQIAKTSNPLSNPALLGWVQDYGQPGNVLINTPNWAASLGDPKVNAMGQGVDQTNTQGWDSPLAWAAFYGGFQGFNKGQPQDNTLQAAQNWAGVTNRSDPSLLGWELDYGNPQTVISTIQASPAYQDYQAKVKAFDAKKAAAQAAFNAQQAAILANRDTQHGNVESLQQQNAGIQNQINQYGATPDLVAQLNNNNAIIARIQSDPNTNFGVTTFVYGLNAPPPPTLSAGGTLTLPSGVGVSGGTGALQSVAGIDVGNFQTTNTAPDFLQAHLSGAKTIETPIGTVSVNPTPLYSAPGPQGSGIPPALLQVASPGQPETALQNLQRQYSALQSPLLNDWLNSQRAMAIHNTQNQALRAQTPEYFNAGAVQMSEFAPGLGSPSNTGLYGFLTPIAGSALGSARGVLPSNLSSSDINQALGGGTNYLLNGGQLFLGTAGGGGGFSNPGARDYGPRSQAGFQGGAFVQFGDFPSYSGGLTPDQFESIWVAANQGQVPGIQYAPPIGGYGGADYIPPSGDNLEFSGPPSVFRDEVQPPGYYGDVSGPVSAPDWFNLPGLGNIPAEWLPFSEGQFPVPEQPDYGDLLPRAPSLWQPPVQPEQPAPSLTDALRSILTPYNPTQDSLNPNISFQPGPTPLSGEDAQAVQAAQPNAGAQPVISQQPGLTPFPDYGGLAPQPFSVPDYGGLSPLPFVSPDYGTINAPADVYTDPGVGFDPDVLYPGGKSQLPLAEPPSVWPPNVKRTDAEAAIQKLGGWATLYQLAQARGGDGAEQMQANRSMLGEGAFNTPLDLSKPLEPQIIRAIPSAWGGEGAGTVATKVIEAMKEKAPSEAVQRSLMEFAKNVQQDIRQDVQQDTEEGGNAAYQPLPPSLTPIPDYGPPAEQVRTRTSFNPDNLRPPADIPYNNAMAAPPASYDLGSSAYIRPETIQGGYNYPPGSFGEVPYPNLLPRVEAPTPYFTAPPYGSIMSEAPPQGAPGGPTPESGQLEIGHGGPDQYDPLAPQGGQPFVTSAPYTFTVPSPSGNESGMGRLGSPGNESYFPPGGGDAAQVLGISGIANIQGEPSYPDYGGLAPQAPEMQAGYRYIPGLFGDNPDPYNNFAASEYQLGQGFGGGFEEAPPAPPEMQAGYVYPSGALGGGDFAPSVLSGFDSGFTAAMGGVAAAPADVWAAAYGGQPSSADVVTQAALGEMGTGGGPVGTALSRGVPKEVLDNAASYVRAGVNTPQLRRMMADAGYPQNDNWCADFASTIQKGLGNQNQIPNAPALASNWMRFGVPGDETNPQPGDIISNMRVNPGEGGGPVFGHIKTVQSYDPVTDRVTTIEGNPARVMVMDREAMLDEYELRSPGPPAPTYVDYPVQQPGFEPSPQGEPTQTQAPSGPLAPLVTTGQAQPGFAVGPDGTDPWATPTAPYTGPNAPQEGTGLTAGDPHGQAAVRYNNPGAMYEKPGMTPLYGSTFWDVIDPALHHIANFPDVASGLAANMQLLYNSPNYIGQTVQHAINTWSGGGRQTVPGFDSNMVLTQPWLNQNMVPFMQSLIQGEATQRYTPQDWATADMYRRLGGAPGGAIGGSYSTVLPGGGPYRGSPLVLTQRGGGILSGATVIGTPGAWVGPPQ